jgi:lipopolysaccharide O-acetyltransferase
VKVRAESIPVPQRLVDWLAEPMKAAQLRAKLARPLRIRQFASYGPHSIVDRPNYVYGAHKTTIGTGCVLLRGAWLAVEKQGWKTDGPVLQLADRVWARPYLTISAAESIIIEEDVVFGSMATVIDSDHTWSAGARNVLWNPVKTAPVRIGSGTWVADRAAILSGTDIGVQCIIGANSVVKGTIPDYSIAVGSPARVVGSTR